MERNILIKIGIIFLIISSVLVNVFSYISAERRDQKKRVVLDEETKDEISLVKEESEKELAIVETINEETIKEEPVKEPKQEKKKNTIVKNITESEVIPFKVVRKHNISNAKTRVRQEGINTIIKKTYQITYEDGVEVSRKLIDEKIQKGQDKIIETLIDYKEPVVEEIEVEDQNKPIYVTKEIYKLLKAAQPFMIIDLTPIKCLHNGIQSVQVQYWCNVSYNCANLRSISSSNLCLYSSIR